ncbi:MAG: DUF4040 domain-containing protein [Nitrospinae bacterium]|nr:DUF4040 domain-containing protein [Nitrospinota bacterium]
MSLSHIVILVFLIVAAISAIMAEDLLSAVILYSAYSFTIALTYLVLRSDDVAMTEAAVGAGVTTLLFLAALSKTSTKEEK